MTANTPASTVLDDDAVVLVTGSTSGIGREIARNLAVTGATVLVHGRDRERARETVEALPAPGGSDDHAWFLADFADLESVRDLAETILMDYDRLDCLVNNAGTMQGERRLVDVPGAAEGIEFTFAVNHLAPFLLTDLLADRLAATGAEERPDPARVVTVSSGLYSRATLDLDGVRGPDGPSALDAYAHSKLANILFTRELARRLPDGVTATCCHPGTAPKTGLGRDGAFLPGLLWRLFGLVGGLVGVTDSPAEAAETPTYLASSPDVTGVSGAYFEDRERVEPDAPATDAAAQRELWERSEAWVGLPAEGSLEA